MKQKRKREGGQEGYSGRHRNNREKESGEGDGARVWWGASKTTITELIQKQGDKKRESSTKTFSKNSQNTLSMIENVCLACNSKLRLSYLKMVYFLTTNKCSSIRQFGKTSITNAFI